MKKKKKLEKEKKLKNSDVDGMDELKKIILIFVIVLAVIGIVYGISKAFIKTNKDNSETIKGQINYDVVSVGTMLNKNENEYYVICFGNSNPKAIYYEVIVNKYLASKKALKVYYCDIENKLNKDYVAQKNDKVNPNATTLDNLKLGDITLLKVKRGKIVKYIDTIEESKKEFKIK